MAERTEYAAVAAYMRLQQRIISCVTLSMLRAPVGYRRHGELVEVMLADGEPVRLRGPERIHLRVRLRLRIEQADPPRGLWDAATAAYEYRLSDEDNREIVAYHWHPDGASQVRTPHLHLGPAAEVGRIALTTAHLPTGQIVPGAVLRLAIESLGAQSIRRDWERVLHPDA